MNAPDRIYNWLDSQFSVARFYGGMRYQGHMYVVDPKTAGAPLVKLSVLIAERKAEKLTFKQLKTEIEKKQRELI